jgi:TonB C terminal
MVDRVAIRSRGSSRVGVSALGVAGALLVHALLVLPFVLDLSLPSRKAPHRNGAGASVLLSAAEPVMTVVFVNEAAPGSTTEPPKLEAFTSRGLESLDLPVVVLSPDAAPAADADRTTLQETTDSSAVASDPAQHALMFGRYVGQVQARIDRAWMRPRTEIGAPRFSCRARVRQDPRGAVIEVTLDHCNGTERWQQSLLSAIRTASPLPAPPDTSVYADILRLSFSSEAFEEGGSTQGFEPETRAANNAERTVLESFQQFVGKTNDDHKSDDNANVIHLTIIGSPADRPTPTQVPAESLLASPPLELQSTELAPR